MDAMENEDRLLSQDMVLERVGLSRTTVWRLLKADDFPKPVRPTAGRKIAWSARQIDRWIIEQRARSLVSA